MVCYHLHGALSNSDKTSIVSENSFLSAIHPADFKSLKDLVYRMVSSVEQEKQYLINLFQSKHPIRALSKDFFHEFEKHEIG
jgi:hypothetical protein